MKLKLKHKVAGVVFVACLLSVVAVSVLSDSFARTRACAWIGDAGCQSELSSIYHAGRKVEQDFSKAAYWNALAVKGGDEKAQKRQQDLEFLQSLKAKKDTPECKGVPADDVAYLISLAEQGNARAQRELGNRRIEPVKWYRLAAEQGDVEAEMQMGSIYFYGDGMGAAVEKNVFEGIKWFKRAAEHGDPDAPTILMNLYQLEIVAAYEGVLHEAHKWSEAVRYSANLPYRIYAPGLVEELGIVKGHPRLNKSIEEDFADMYYWARFSRKYADYAGERAAHYLTAKKKAELDAKVAALQKLFNKKSQDESLLNVAGLICGSESRNCKIADSCGDIVFVVCPPKNGEYPSNFVSKTTRKVLSRVYCTLSVPKEWKCGPPAGILRGCTSMFH